MGSHSIKETVFCALKSLISSVTFRTNSLFHAYAVLAHPPQLHSLNHFLFESSPELLWLQYKLQEGIANYFSTCVHLTLSPWETGNDHHHFQLTPIYLHVWYHRHHKEVTTVWWLRAQALEADRTELKVQPNCLLVFSPQESYYSLTSLFPHQGNGYKISPSPLGWFWRLKDMYRNYLS